MASAINFVRTVALASAALVATQASAAVFDGPYVGGQIGWQQDKLDWRYGEGKAVVETDTSKASGFTYGGFLGYNFNLNGSGIIGLEAGVSDTSGEFKDDWATRAMNVGIRFDIAARAGMLVSPQTLVYLRGGYANQKYSVHTDGSNTKVSSSRDGWTLGAGIEQAMTENVSARVEYNYAKFSRYDFAKDLGTAVNEFTVRPEAHTIRVGVAYNF